MIRCNVFTRLFVSLLFIVGGMASLQAQDAYSSPQQKLLAQQVREKTSAAREMIRQGYALQAYQQYLTAVRLLKERQSDADSMLELSWEVFAEALVLTDTLLGQYHNAASRLVLTRYISSLYIGAVDVGYQLYLKTGSKQYFEACFLLAEKNRNIMLLEAVRQSGLTAGDQQLQSSFLLLQQYNTAIFLLRNSVDTELSKMNPAKPKLKKMTDSLAVLQNKADSVSDGIRKRAPAFYSFMSRREFAGLTQVQSMMKDMGQALIEYWMADDALYIFAVKQNDVLFIKVPDKDGLHQLVLDFLSSIQSGAPSGFAAYSHELYRRIFFPMEPFLKTCTKVRIVPDDFLAYVPFECLLAKMPAHDDSYAELDYLLSHYCFSYSPSATLLKENYRKREGLTDGRMIAFAPAFKPSDGSISVKDSLYDHLPEQRWALRFVEKLESEYQGIFYTETEATSGRFLNEAGQFGIIHLASHSIFNEEDPLSSMLIFSRDLEDVSSSSPYIYARDIYSMKLNSSLVVLGSCKSGFGSLRKGEGMLSLAYAFSYAGCPALVYSLWEVDEKESMELLDYFYEGLSEGLPKDEALQQAKLKMLKESGDLTASPFYWSGFVLSGDDSPVVPLKRRKLSWIAWVMGGSVIVIITIAFILGKRRRQRKIFVSLQNHLKNQ